MLTISDTNLPFYNFSCQIFSSASHQSRPQRHGDIAFSSPFIPRHTAFARKMLIITNEKDSQSLFRYNLKSGPA
jgi:hypothetical protein